MNHYTVLIIGSGFGGQCSAINLLQQGINDFCILERREFMGGTWCQNTYPGAAVDVQSPLYSISSEPYQWTQMFAEQSELQEYTNYVIDKHQLRSKTQTNSNVLGMQWNADSSLWEVEVEGKGVFTAKYVVNASGPLSTPVIPNFKGKYNFKGKSFHTNYWDNNYDYKGKRVAIIGSGASAAQAIPAIAEDVEHLYVLQRSPHWVLPRPDRKFTDWQRKLLGVKWVHKLLRTAIYWELESRVIAFKYFGKKVLESTVQKQAKAFIKKSIQDPELRAKLTPDFTIGCKRIILSSTLYPALSRDNVSLLDKDQGIEEIKEHSIVTQDGQELEVDLIVYSTGYDATDGVISYPVVGKDNNTLADFWSDFPRAYLGTSIPNFPNLFIVTGPNTGIGHTSAIFIIEAQMKYIMQSIKTAMQKDRRVIEVKPCAEGEYTSMIHSEMQRTVWEFGGCNSWYKSKSGKVVAMFPGFSFSYRKMAVDFKHEHHIYS